MCITSQGKSIKLKVNTIRVMGRSARGVKILSIDKPDFVIGVDRIVQEDALEAREKSPGQSSGADAVPAGTDASLDAADDDAPPETGDELPDTEAPETDRKDQLQGDLFDGEE
jgi:DNA gyrase/topoisomerase IV subunit A